VIKFWSNSREFRELSNFYPSCVLFAIDGREYQFECAEAAYQACKLAQEKDIHKFLDLSGVQAKKSIQGLQIRKDWDKQLAVGYMFGVLEAKFDQSQHMREVLEMTRGHMLLHYAPWDTFWGYSPVKGGANMLGYMLMSRRGILAS
jgi:ribA/ribD-fused uncharacterized protein